MKDRFLNLLSEVKRPGMDQLTKWLTDKSDFFTAPASTKYHGAVEGGLLEHSLAVYDELVRFLEWHGTKCAADAATVIALLHDICKANFYAVSERNVKDPIIEGEQKTGWFKMPYYTIEDKFPYGHGEKSVYIINEFTHLSVDEAMAIRWHMGAWNAESYADKRSLSAAMDKYPLILALQIADQAASYFDKK